MEDKLYHFAKLILILTLLLQAGCSLLGYRTLYIENAALTDPTMYDAELKNVSEKGKASDKDFLPVVAHRICNGTGTAIAYRKWSPGSWFIIDDEGYEKITIYIPHILEKEGNIILGTNTGTISIIASGGSAWPKTGLIGVAQKGSIKYKRTSSHEIEVEIDLVVNLYNISWNELGPSRHFHEQVTLKKKDIHSITPWEGREGSHIYDETYP